ncbi:MAG: hypothetical protein K1X55_15035 [Chitinophagales bacterium]|nr:hypothetical protein [Chitinophagales bacterium]
MLLWDKVSEAFVPLELERRKPKDTRYDFLEYNISEVDKYYYDISPYYGYDEAEIENIALLSQESILNDTLMYVLGRSYSNYCRNIYFKLEYLSQEEVNDSIIKIKTLFLKAIECYKEVKRINPDFQTILGLIGTTLDCEYISMVLFLQPFIQQDELWALVPNNLFDGSIKAFALNNLNTCDSNAILFSEGDVPTFSIMYYQQKYGIRKDVLHLNTSMLNDNKYIKYFQELDHSLMRIPYDFFQNNQLDYLYIDKENKSEFDITNLVGEILRLKSNQASLSFRDSILLPLNLSCKNENNQLTWIGSFFDNVIIKNQIIFLDILNNNFGKRPINIIINVDYSFLCGLNSYFRDNGTLNKLTDEPCYEAFRNVCLNVQELYKNIYQNFVLDGFEKIDYTKDVYCLQYIMKFVQLSQYFDKVKNDRDSAKMILDDGIKKLKIFESTPSKYLIELVREYYRLEDFETGNAIFIHILKHKEVLFSNEHNLYDNLGGGISQDDFMENVDILANQYGQRKTLKKYLK